jgi:glycosyltransferase involved in cell wall biosynthesis
MPGPDHVMLNALFLDPAASGGPETYMRGLVPALHRERPAARLTVVTTRSGAAALRRDGWGEWVEVRELPCEDGQRLRRTWAEQVLLPRLARRLRADVLHSLASLAPVRPRVPAAITLHDVTFVLRRTFSRTTTVGMREIMLRAARRADALLAPSAATRNEICALFGLDPDNVAVVPHGAGRPPEVEPVPEAALRRRHGLGAGRVVLCVAAKRPHKNQVVLLRALQQLAERRCGPAGHAEPYEDELRAEAARLGVQDRVRFLEFVPDAELEGLWRPAECAAFPTLGEGFGLLVIEAMARGVPEHTKQPTPALADPANRRSGGELETRRRAQRKRIRRPSRIAVERMRRAGSTSRAVAWCPRGAPAEGELTYRISGTATDAHEYSAATLASREA